MPRARGVLAAGLAGFGIASIIAAPAAYSLTTAATPHSGAIPSAGPAVQGGGFGGGSAARWPRPGNGLTLPPGFTLPNGEHAAQGSAHPRQFLPARCLCRRAGSGRIAGGQARADSPVGRLRRILAGSGGGARGFGGGEAAARADSGGLPAACSTARLRASSWSPCSARAPRGTPGWPPPPDPTRPRATSWPPGTRSWPSAASTAPTRPRPWPSSRSTWPRAGSTTTSVAVGGFGGGGFGASGTSDSSQIASWVAHFTAETVDGVTVYDLTAPAS